MKTLLVTLLLSVTLTGASIYDFKVAGLDGNEIDFAKYKGKKIMIVNTASKCGLTPQYEGLQQLYDKYKNKLVIIGFPANNFNGQEPGSKEEIAEFCKKNYGVTFPMADKVSVKGDDIAPIYKFLEEEAAKKGLAARFFCNNRVRKMNVGVNQLLRFYTGRTGATGVGR